jgi:tetratricopeptide (TPR) repeat protein
MHKTRYRFSICSVIFSLLFAFGAMAQENNTADKGAFYEGLRLKYLNRLSDAEEQLQSFAKTNPKESVAYFELAKIAIQNKNLIKAQVQIKKAIDLDSNNQWYMNLLGDILIEQGNYSEAAKLYAQLAKKYKYNDQYLMQASRLFQIEKKYDLALEQLRILIDQNSEDNEDLLLQKQELFIKNNQLDSAIALSEQLVNEHKEEPRFYLLLSELYSSQNKLDKKNKLDSLIAVKFPNDGMVLLNKISTSLSNHDTAAYKAQLEKIITNKTIAIEDKIAVLVPYLEINKDSNSNIQYAQLLSEANATQYTAYQLLGDVYAMYRNTLAASSAYKKSIQLNPSNYKAWEQLIINTISKETADSLVIYAERAIRLFPNQADLYYFAGIGYAYLNLHANAIRNYNRCLDLQDESKKMLLSEIYASLAESYHELKEFEKADQAFEEALKLDEKNVNALNNYSYYLSIRKERINYAEKLSKKAITLSPSIGSYQDTYGWIMYQLKNYSKAKEYVIKAIELNSPNADATLYDHLGDIEFQLGNLNEALLNWEKAKEKGMDTEELKYKLKNKRINE